VKRGHAYRRHGGRLQADARQGRTHRRDLCRNASGTGRYSRNPRALRRDEPSFGGCSGESGAFKALTLDLAEELGLPLADLHDEDSPELRAALPPFVPVSNPLDITAQGLSQPIIYTQSLGALMDDARVGAVVAGIIQSDPITAKIKVPAIVAALDGRDHQAAGVCRT
jgi:hypothetical protein